MKSSIITDHTLIIDELETTIKIHNLDLILCKFLEKLRILGSTLGRTPSEIQTKILIFGP